MCFMNMNYISEQEEKLYMEEQMCCESAQSKLNCHNSPSQKQPLLAPQQNHLRICQMDVKRACLSQAGAGT